MRPRTEQEPGAPLRKRLLREARLPICGTRAQLEAGWRALKNKRSRTLDLFLNLKIRS